jgi:hypothetical protein
MIADTALSVHARALLRGTGRDEAVDKADFFADGWGIRYRNLEKRRHIRMTRGPITWQETVTEHHASSSVTVTGVQLPETILIEDRMVGRKMGEILDLPPDMADLISQATITERIADTTDYIPIPILILQYE